MPVALGSKKKYMIMIINKAKLITLKEDRSSAELHSKVRMIQEIGSYITLKHEHMRKH